MRGRHRERGSSLPETAIILVALLLLIFGIVDFGRAMYAYAFVAQLAREGARYAIVRGSQCTLLSNCPNVTSAQIATYVQSLSEGATGAQSAISSSTTWSCPNQAENPGCTASVFVSYTFNPIFPYIKIGALTLSSTSKMVVSQ